MTLYGMIACFGIAIDNLFAGKARSTRNVAVDSALIFGFGCFGSLGLIIMFRSMPT